MIKLIGVTGQTGAGKTTITEMIAQQTGWGIIDADILAREVVQKGSPILKELALTFGGDILLPNGTLHRKKLAKRAFSSAENVQKLNSITHPAITNLVIAKAKAMEAEGTTHALLDAAALFESGEDKLTQFTIAVIAPTDIRLERILSRDQITKEDALIRIAGQPKESFYTSRADFIICTFPEDKIQIQIDDVIKQMKTSLSNKKDWS